MIFGKDHVYTFDSKYFRFPGYNNEHCTYILARDVRDNKFTLMSQETALLLITEDANVKVRILCFCFLFSVTFRALIYFWIPPALERKQKL
jgi:hypothetical protein